MKKNLLLLVGALLLTSCDINIIVTNPYISEESGTQIITTNSDVNKVLNIINNKWRSDIYYGDLNNKDAAIAQFISAMSNFNYQTNLDPYTYLIHNEMATGIAYSGKIGITLGNYFQVPVVTFVNPGSAGEAAGLKEYDIVYGLGRDNGLGGVNYHYFYEDGYLFSNLVSSVANNIGAKVGVKYYRLEGDTLVDYETIITLKEAPKTLYSYTEDLGYDDALTVKLTEFEYGQTDTQLLDILKDNAKLATPKKKIIIDLIDNPGGSLNAVVNCLSYFLPYNSLAVTLEDKNGAKTDYKTNHLNPYTFDSIEILTSNNTASASEVFIKCMQYYFPDTLTLKGAKTYGKSIATNTETINNEWSFQYTCAKWLDPSGTWFEMYDGIEPDVTIDKSNTLKICQELYATMQYNDEFNYDTVSSNNICLANILNSLTGSNLRVDGYFDQDMVAAVNSYQSAHNISVTGKIDHLTYIYLVNEYASSLSSYKQLFMEHN